MNILILGDYFFGWTGGANILGRIVRVTLKAAQVTGDQVLLGVSRKFVARMDSNNQLPLCIKLTDLRPSGPFETFLAECPELKEIYIYDELNKFISSKEINIIGPTGANLAGVNCPWLAYIPDFQHQYLPRFFSTEERFARDAHFRKIVEHSDGIYVNSRSVVSDLQRFYPGYFPPKKIFTFPLLESVVPLEPSTVDATIRKYLLSANYFISCSQRWMHKQHEVIARAFIRLCDSHPEQDYELVFTGSTDDYRDRSYSLSVSDEIVSSKYAARIKSLGLIPRKEQLDLIYGSSCLIQASLFEGGPGASGMQEAAQMGTPIIASDISPNLEFNQGQVSYFNANSEVQLSERLFQVTRRNERGRFENLGAKDTKKYVKDEQDLASGIRMLNDFNHVVLSSKAW